MIDLLYNHLLLKNEEKFHVKMNFVYQLLFENFTGENSNIDQQYEKLKSKDWLMKIS